MQGEAGPVGSAKVGYLAQEPELDAEKTVLENVMEGVADKTAIVQRFEEVTKLLEASPNVNAFAHLLGYTLTVC